ncbi:MAG: menaquinone biosynthetic enzyme MqnA/MqnD family protein [Bacteroidales bacterium]
MKRSMKISIVKYINSIPYRYAIEHLLNLEVFQVQIDTPAVCAENLLLNKVDMGLIPVAKLLADDSLKRVTDYGICACKSVRTVILVSNSPIDKLRTIYLDSHSRSSAMLIKVLAKHHWAVRPNFVDADVAAMVDSKVLLKDDEGMLLIGDKVFSAEKTLSFGYTYDLAEEWFSMTGLPFVFAAWAVHKDMNMYSEGLLNEAFAATFTDLEQLLPINSTYTDDADILDYWQNNIIFRLGEEEKRGLEKFREFIR